MPIQTCTDTSGVGGAYGAGAIAGEPAAPPPRCRTMDGTWNVALGRARRSTPRSKAATSFVLPQPLVQNNHQQS
ncbi:hypothetical protein chiPu_0011059 [Chiloscyllium punctatum]|uniref:Uncharacterized protein n=1 Tax=Chiloscyllium punctatum TaxID=137246 RepID=A0A401SQF0_CHIPU|nr:hypothetical protein [Chiloscyllium punctatum]